MKSNPYRELIQLGFMDSVLYPLINEMKEFAPSDIKGKTADETQYKLGEAVGRTEALDNLILRIKRKANNESSTA